MTSPPLITWCSVSGPPGCDGPGGQRQTDYRGDGRQSHAPADRHGRGGEERPTGDDRKRRYVQMAEGTAHVGTDYPDTMINPPGSLRPTRNP